MSCHVPQGRHMFLLGGSGVVQSHVYIGVSTCHFTVSSLIDQLNQGRLSFKLF